MTDFNITESQLLYDKVRKNISRVMRGQEKSIRLLLAGFLSGGHVLLEDFPGTGKTTMAKALAKSVDVTFKRCQFTPDLLPSDILGVSIYNQQEHAFRFHQGPIFTNILLADEINRASPRTQSALLEAMAERQVSQEGQMWQLDDPFFVIATQNPVESRGTYPLPEAQMDRFAIRFSLGYVSPEDEAHILEDQKTHHPVDAVEACAKKEDILRFKEDSRKVHISEELKNYIIAITGATRSRPGIQLGASPRASLALMNISKTLALFDGLPYVLPDHIQEVAVPVIAHRLVLDPQTRFSGTSEEQLVHDIVQEITVPT